MASIGSVEELRLDDLLINNFREAVMDSKNFIETCMNIGNKNKMNVIYSAMDWLNVGVEGTINVDFKINGIGYNHANTLKLTQYIICVDLILESIRQIYRILEQHFEIIYPYKKTNHIFNHFSLSDDDYFKHLRAVFGIHPVNLTSIDGTEDKKNHKRYFASWVAYSFPKDEYDFIVQIYGNTTDYDSSEIFGINLSLINGFVKERYGLLEEVIDHVNNINNEKVHKYKGVQINLTSNVIDDLEILKKENVKRFSKYEGYSSLIEYIKDCFECNKKRNEITFDYHILDIYIERLEKVTLLIKSNLENVRNKNIFIGINARGYEFEKIERYLHYKNNEVGREYFEGLILHSELPEEFSNIKDFKMYKFVYDAFLYYNMRGNEYILYKDLLKNPEVYIFNGVIGFTGYRL